MNQSNYFGKLKKGQVNYCLEEFVEGDFVNGIGGKILRE